jgi:hypothetical protein
MAGLKVATLKKARTCPLPIRQKHGLGYWDGHIKKSPPLSYIELISGLMMLPSITLPSQDKDLRVVNEPVGDSRGNSCGVKHLSPFSKWQI